MARKLKIYLADLAHDYLQANFTAPLGVAFISEYINSIYPGKLDVKLFKSPGKLADALNNGTPPDILGLSNYSWNEGLNRLFEEKIGTSCPNTVIIQGGPHIRTDRDGIAAHLRDHPNVDFYAMFEGEWPMGHLVGHMLEENKVTKPLDIDSPIPGIAFLKKGELIYEPYSSQKSDLEKIPSPYLSGALDEYINETEYQPLIETNRGCPFACTFCAWGISALNKVRRFSTDRVIKEIEYIADRTPSTFWQFTDANFGMYERDIDIAHAINSASNVSPLQRISINWAKNSSKFCTEIQHILRGISEPLVAVQSTDKEVLVNVKRGNIKMSTMTDLVEQGRKDGIQFTTDVLSCLPGETVESHFNTLRDVFDLGFQYFSIGPIRMLPGSEMETEESREKFGLKTQFRLISGGYGVYDGKPVVEYEESIVASNDMSRAEVQMLRVVHFFVWVMWNSGLGQPLLRWMNEEKGVNPLDAILPLIQKGNDATLDVFLDDFHKEIDAEWFDSKEELLTYYEKNFEELIAQDYVKTNLKYLARILLDKSLAETILGIVAKQSDDPLASELAIFSMERIFFPGDNSIVKEKVFSASAVNALSRVYPATSSNGTTTCKFSVTEKLAQTFEFELEKFGFAEAPVRSLALFLQLYGTDMIYDFAFGEKVEAGQSQQAFDSFDYAGETKQMNSHSGNPMPVVRVQP